MIDRTLTTRVRMGWLDLEFASACVVDNLRDIAPGMTDHEASIWLPIGASIVRRYRDAQQRIERDTRNDFAVAS